MSSLEGSDTPIGQSRLGRRMENLKIGTKKSVRHLRDFVKGGEKTKRDEHFSPPSRFKSQKLAEEGEASTAIVLKSPVSTIHYATEQETLESVSCGWRDCQSLEEFAKLAKWDNNTFERVKSRPEYIELDFSEALDYLGRSYVGYVIRHLSRDGKPRDIDWSRVPTSKQPNGIYALYAQLVRVHFTVDSHKIKEYHSLFTWLYPVFTQNQKVENALKSALQRGLPAAGDEDYVERLWATITQYFKDYNPSTCLSPYTSIIGPMGIGKTRAIEELARRGKCFVSYLNLASESSLAFPKRSVIADTIAKEMTRSELTTFFECYVASALAQTVLCRKTGITASGFWDLQALEEFGEFQVKIHDCIYEFFQSALNLPARTETPHERIRSEDDPSPSAPYTTQLIFDHQQYVNQLLPDHTASLTSIFESARKLLEARGNSSVYLSAKEPNACLRDDMLECLVCLDETRTLFPVGPSETTNTARFGALRRAFRHRAMGPKRTRKPQFFGIVTDTASRVSDLSPAKGLDDSLRSSTLPRDLFQPIWKIRTFDTMANMKLYKDLPTCEIDLDESYAKELFSFGRPLWASLLQNVSVDELQHFIRSKIVDFEVTPPRLPDEKLRPTEVASVRDLALFSYRCSFHVDLQSLSEQLASNYLHFIADINEERTLVRILQPAEPILAWVAANEMMPPGKKRLDVAKAIHYHVQRGYISVGDIGEIIAVLIILFAFDDAHGPGTPRPIPFRQFIRSLVPSILDSVEKKIAGNPTLRRFWAKGSVHLGQFTRTEREYVNMETLRRAYARRAALVAPSNSEGFDLIIPVYLGPGEDQGMSYLIIQVKNDKAKHLTDGVKREARLALRPKDKLGSPDYPAYFGLYMSLRGKKKSRKAGRSKGKGREREGSVENPALSHDRTWVSAVEIALPEHIEEEKIDRVVIVSAGCDENIYECLKGPPGITDTLQSLLNCSAWINVPSRSQYLQSLFPIDSAEQSS